MNEKTKKVIDWIIKIVLVIIIIILLVHNCTLVKKQKDDNKNPKPTGNVEIIEIKCDNDENCISNKDDTAPVNAEDGELTGFTVIDEDNITWNGVTEAKIFSNSMYEPDTLIAPEFSNTYQFVVKNGTDYNIKYKITFSETNPYDINMKYKLKKNDTYLVDDYVSLSELNDIAENYLNNDKNDTYYLDWKWFSSSNDTAIGETPDASYGLKIEIKAESIHG